MKKKILILFLVLFIYLEKKNKKKKFKKKIFFFKFFFFFSLKSFLNDFKAILRAIFFVGLFGGAKFALEKNKKIKQKNVKKRQKWKKMEKISRQISPPPKNPKNFFAVKTALKSFKNDF